MRSGAGIHSPIPLLNASLAHSSALPHEPCGGSPRKRDRPSDRMRKLGGHFGPLRKQTASIRAAIASRMKVMKKHYSVCQRRNRAPVTSPAHRLRHCHSRCRRRQPHPGQCTSPSLDAHARANAVRAYHEKSIGAAALVSLVRRSQPREDIFRAPVFAYDFSSAAPSRTAVELGYCATYDHCPLHLERECDLLEYS